MGLRGKRQSEDNIYLKLIGCFTKNGKKTKSENIISNLLQNLTMTEGLTKTTSFDIVNKINDLLLLEMDIKKVNMKNRLILIPVPLTSARQNYLVVSRIMSGFVDKNKETKLKDKLFQEFISILQSDSKGLSEKYETLATIKQNKANSHFRW